MQQHMELDGSSVRVASLDPATTVGTVTLKVADLRRSLAFYNDVIGLRTFVQDGRTVVLGAGSRRILSLVEVPGARRQPAQATGLYHAAILFPDRHSLAVKVAQIAAQGRPLGQADHLVSEAFYLSDPDGNGLELYRDRPRGEWAWSGDQVQMAIDPIDFEDFFAGIDISDAPQADPAAPDGTRLGHVHLRVADIVAAEKFYHDVLGFAVTASMPGALFVSAGGYHHHLGLNTWESRGGKPPAEPSTGLAEFSIALPDQVELDRLAQQVEAAGVAVECDEASATLLDPFQNRIRLVLEDRLARDW